MNRKVICVFVILLSAVFLVGCSALPDQTVSKFLDALKAANGTEMAKYVQKEDTAILESEFEWDTPEDEEMAKTLFGKISYEIAEPDISKDTATVSVDVTCLDMPRILSDAISKVFPMAIASALGDEDDIETQAMFEQILENAVKDPNAPMTTVETTLNLKKIDGKWLIVFDEKSSSEFLNAVTGNLGKMFGE